MLTVGLIIVGAGLLLLVGAGVLAGFLPAIDELD